jgi:hypothetical protein
MNRLWPSLATLAVCVFSAAIQLYWGGQDQQGRFHADYLWANGNLGISLFILGPYFLFLVSALIAWRRRASRGGLVLAAVLCGIGVLAGWVDHDQYLRTPPGRETPQMLNFIATLVLWLGSVGALVSNVLRRQKRA